MLAALAAACGHPAGPSVALAHVADAPQETTAKALTLTARSVRDVRGVGRWSTRNPRSVGVKEASIHEMWVVPLIDPGAALGTQVYAWVTPSAPIADGATPDAWFAQLASELDDHTLTLKVATRASEARRTDSGWGKALADAETRLGVASHPDAPVLFFPSP